MKSNRFWIALFAAILIISTVAAFLLRQGPANRVNVYQDGEFIKSVYLSEVEEPYTFTVEHENGTNLISVENGRIRISGADCPDGACIRQGWVGGGNTPIVCLPHRLVIKPETATAPDIDAIAR